MPFHKKPKFPQLLAPYYEKLNFYDGVDGWIEACESVPDYAVDLYSVHWTYLEVENGGFAQYLINSTGVIAPEAVNGYRAIGMPEVSQLVSKAMATLGDPYPRDTATRRNLLGMVNDDLDEARKDFARISEPYDEVDRKFWELTGPRRLFFSHYRYHQYCDRYAEQFINA